MIKKQSNISGPNPTWNIEQPYDQTKTISLNDIWETLKGNNKNFIVEWFECEDEDNCLCPPDEFGRQYRPDGNGLCIRFADPVPEVKEAASGFVKVVVETSVPPHVREQAGGDPVAWISSEDDERVVHLNKSKLPDASLSSFMAIARDFSETFVHEWFHEKTVNRPSLSQLEGNERAELFEEQAGSEHGAEAAGLAAVSSVHDSIITERLVRLGNKLDFSGNFKFANAIDEIIIKIATANELRRLMPENTDGLSSDEWFTHDTKLEPTAANINGVQNLLYQNGYDVGADTVEAIWRGESTNVSFDTIWGEKSSNSFKKFISDFIFILSGITIGAPSRSACQGQALMDPRCVVELLNKTILSGSQSDIVAGFHYAKLAFACEGIHSASDGVTYRSAATYLSSVLSTRYGFDCAGLEEVKDPSELYILDEE